MPTLCKIRAEVIGDVGKMKGMGTSETRQCNTSLLQLMLLPRALPRDMALSRPFCSLLCDDLRVVHRRGDREEICLPVHFPSPVGPLVSAHTPASSVPLHIWVMSPRPQPLLRKPCSVLHSRCITPVLKRQTGGERVSISL